MKEFTRNILLTGGAGFIGSHLVRRLVKKYPYYRIINLDVLTYAGNLVNLSEIENMSNYIFVKANICDSKSISKIFHDYQIDGVIHLAAESHVDRSIIDPLTFVNTNVIGTVVLLQAAQEYWKDKNGPFRFYHVSTDEVYGSLGDNGYFTEKTPYDPRSPYSASKASSDHFVRAWYHTYQLPVVMSNCSNNYGPFHFPEKLIPLAINNIKNKKSVPVYGNGKNIRDWLFVEDHVKAIDVIFHKGKNGETYNIGGNQEMKNIDLITLLCNIMDKKMGRNPGESASLITFVEDRAGHDFRYAIDSNKLKKELGWEPSLKIQEGLEKTVDWYLENENWLNKVVSGNKI